MISDKNVLDVEMLYYPLSILQQEHEDIETTVLPNLSHHMLIEVLRYCVCIKMTLINDLW